MQHEMSGLHDAAQRVGSGAVSVGVVGAAELTGADGGSVGGVMDLPFCGWWGGTPFVL